MHKKTSWLTSGGGIYSASPDDALFRLVSSLYASGHPHMSSGDNCGLQGRSSNLLRLFPILALVDAENFWVRALSRHH